MDSDSSKVGYFVFMYTHFFSINGTETTHHNSYLKRHSLKISCLWYVSSDRLDTLWEFKPYF